jgi:hypothetical protein
MSSFLSALAKFGQIVANFAGIAAGLGPIFKGALPGQAGTIDKVESEISLIAGQIQTVESIGQALSIKGPDKLKAAAPLVAQVILQSALMAGHEYDPVLFTQGSTKIADGFADVLNSIKADKVQAIQPKDVK